MRNGRSAVKNERQGYSAPICVCNLCLCVLPILYVRIYVSKFKEFPVIYLKTTYE